MSEYEPKLVHLPGTVLTPEVVLHRTLNKSEHIKSVAVVIQWADGSFDVDWSQMQMSEMCMASMVIQKQVTAILGDD